MPVLSVVVLCTNERRFLPRCLGALAAQTRRDFEILVVDNASSDGSAEYVAASHPEVRLLRSDRNLYYCGGQNLGIRASRAEFVLPLNADVFLAPEFLERALAPMAADACLGQVQGKLYQIAAEAGLPAEGLVIDTTGIEVRRSRRNFDRGQEEPDIGQYDHPEEIFGADGSAPLYRRAMLDDVAVGGQYFPEDFRIYREVVDLSWRARRRGWGALFEPGAVAFHVRGFSPRTRASQPPLFRRFSLRNRWATLIRNETWAGLRPDLGPVLGFELLMLGHALLRERHLFRVPLGLARDLGRLLAERRIIQARARRPAAEIGRFFT